MPAIRTDESRLAVASVRLRADPPLPPPRSEAPIDPNEQFGARAFSTGFDLAPDNETVKRAPDLDWEWMLRPRGLGSHAVTFQFTKPVIAEDQLTMIKIQPGWILRATRQSIIVSIDVFDELGLSSRQRAWAITIGGLISLLGTIFALPFIARLFKPA